MKTVQLDFPSPAALKVQAQFEHWRNTRYKRSKIPNELWFAAAKLTKIHSINKVAKLMRLNASDLSKKSSSVSSSAIEENEGSPVSFIEFPNISNCNLRSCEVDLKRPDGSEMQIRLPNVSVTDLPTLIQAFVN
ncbi:MAG: hypothetical protein HOE30_25655 [Deltaproteobacteria bacterium]|jgi:hypothetical protein|nr:hypothetical protein [Deltaproteobacteria bacterium]MBT4285862.1 hypothetical protein [Deltaproteobacteria bacterium]MBT6612398.1 hypothetical protein [Deltaproteobacteria bacterium]MBT7483347.1 hypothetical protein [Candidatus Peregrinibacteria bacterium]